MLKNFSKTLPGSAPGRLFPLIEWNLHVWTNMEAGGVFGPSCYFPQKINKRLDHVSLLFMWSDGAPAFSLPCTSSWSAITENMFPALISIREDRLQDYSGSENRFFFIFHFEKEIRGGCTNIPHNLLWNWRPWSSHSPGV